MTRVDEIQKRYPDIHRHIIAKWDVLNRGVKDTPDLDKASTWSVPLPSYQTYDHDFLLQDLKAKGKMKEGRILRPPAMWFSSGLGARTLRSTVDPYEVRDMGNGEFALFDGEEKVLDVSFPLETHNFDLDPEVTSRGTPVRKLVLVERDNKNLRIMTTHFCEYFTKGEECRFCNFNSSQDDLRAVGLDQSITVNPEDTLEAYKILALKRSPVNVTFEAGGFLSGEAETNVLCKFVEQLSKVLPYKPTFGLIGEALTREQYQRLKDAGLDAPAIHMEVWAPGKFEKICPGKARHMPREGWLQAIHDAVDIFGVGKVLTTFVAGAALLGPDAFEDPEEAKASHIEGQTFCIKHGSNPWHSALRWAKGSPFSRDPANRAKFPPTDYYLDIAVAHHKDMMEYGLYPKVKRGLGLNEYMYCGEIGIFAGAVPGVQVNEGGAVQKSGPRCD